MSSLTKQIVDELMEKFKNENPDNIIKIIQELRNNIRESRIEQDSVY
jgi:FMN-dependent NADH-azoreductase